jgi:Tfp pilus assembly protein PilV
MRGKLVAALIISGIVLAAIGGKLINERRNSPQQRAAREATAVVQQWAEKVEAGESGAEFWNDQRPQHFLGVRSCRILSVDAWAHAATVTVRVESLSPIGTPMTIDYACVVSDAFDKGWKIGLMMPIDREAR